MGFCATLFPMKSNGTWLDLYVMKKHKIMTCTYRTSKPKNQILMFPHVDNMVNEFFNTAVGEVFQNRGSKRINNPAVNVIEYDDRFELHLALPGFAKKDLDIILEKDVLKISAKQKDGVSKSFKLREFNYSGFSKTFKIPDTVDNQKITASSSTGVLALILPKKKEAARQSPKKILIK